MYKIHIYLRYLHQCKLYIILVIAWMPILGAPTRWHVTVPSPAPVEFRRGGQPSGLALHSPVQNTREIGTDCHANRVGVKKSPLTGLLGCWAGTGRVVKLEQSLIVSYAETQSLRPVRSFIPCRKSNVDRSGARRSLCRCHPMAKISAGECETTLRMDGQMKSEGS